MSAHADVHIVPARPAGMLSTLDALSEALRQTAAEHGAVLHGHALTVEIGGTKATHSWGNLSVVEVSS